MTIYVTKADGSRQLFSRSKIVRTCMRMHASPQAARAVADAVAGRAYDGIRTKQILKMIFAELKKYRPEVALQIDLRESIALLRPKPDFEQFVAAVLEAEGYKVETNKIIAGKCTEHEVDAVAKKDNEVVCVEVKHHYQHHTYTGLGVFLESWASFEDLQAGHAAGGHNINFNKLLVACNTKMSDHAKQYAACKDFDHLAWKSPEQRSLEQLIEEHRLYPITFLKGLDASIAGRLGDAGIVTLKQLVQEDADKLARQLRMPRKRIKELIDRADKLLSSSS